MQGSYNFSIKMYLLGARISSLWNSKARKWVGGRKSLLSEIEAQVKGDKIAWFHCSSLGEFEQGRPVLEGFKQKHPDYKMLLTFFSPSGYEVRKNYKEADWVFYLPADTQDKARKFVEIVQPKIAVFVKYDFWFNFLQTLHDKHIPIVYISAVFRSDQYFFKSKGKWFLEKLKMVDHFFVQDKDSLRILLKNGIENAMAVGDTRFDRVMQIAKNPNKFPVIEKFKGDKKLIIAGSTWPRDELMMKVLTTKRGTEFKYLIAPHEIEDKRIEELMESIELPSIRFSEATEENVENKDVLIIDSIGHLAHIYQYADLAFIGGGFDKGIHNILEAAAFGVPVIFGPNYKKFQEATDLINAGGAYEVYAFRNINHKLNDLFFEEEKLNAIKQTVANFMAERTGASKAILEGLDEILEKQESA